MFGAAVLVASLSLAAAGPTVDGWNTFTEGTRCHYKHVADKESWFHAARHCQESEGGSDLARILSVPEAQFVASLSEEPKWVFNFYEEGKWNTDFDARKLWAPNQPGNIEATLKFCAAQTAGSDGSFHAEQCNQKLSFVCKRCPSEAAENKVVPTIAPPVVAPQRERRADNDDNTEPDVVQSTTTTTTEEPQVGDQGGVAGLAAGSISILDTASTGAAATSSSTVAVVAATFCATLLLVGVAFGAKRMVAAHATGKSFATADATVVEMTWDDEITVASLKSDAPQMALIV